MILKCCEKYGRQASYGWSRRFNLKLLVLPPRHIHHIVIDDVFVHRSPAPVSFSDKGFIIFRTEFLFVRLDFHLHFLCFVPPPPKRGGEMMMMKVTRRNDEHWQNNYDEYLVVEEIILRSSRQ